MRDIIQAALYFTLVVILAILVGYAIVDVYVLLTQKECIEGYIWSVRMGACIPGYIPK